MRHVQLVALPDSDENAGLLATATHVFKRTASGKLERDGSAIALYQARSGKVLGTMSVEGALLAPPTFSSPVAWRFLDAGSSRSVAVVEKGSLVVRHFPTGKVQCRVGGAKEILDGRAYVDGGGQRRFEVLVSSGDAIRRVECDGAGKWIRDHVVSRTGVAGAFVRRFDRTILGTAVDGIAILERPWGEDALGAGVRVLGRAGEVQRVMDLPETVAFAKETWAVDFRCAAWRSEEGLLVAFSQPRFDHSVGRLTLVDLSSAGQESVLYDGIPWPRLSVDSINQSSFGQCLGFVNDVDGDGLPDVVVGTPTAFFVGPPALLVLGSASKPGQGEEQARFGSEDFDRIGTSVSIGPLGRRALVGVAPPRYPEDLAQAGYACLLEVPKASGEPFVLVKKYSADGR